MSCGVINTPPSLKRQFGGTEAHTTMTANFDKRMGTDESDTQTSFACPHSLVIAKRRLTRLPACTTTPA